MCYFLFAMPFTVFPNEPLYEKCYSLEQSNLTKEKMNKALRYVIYISVPVITSANSVNESLYSHLFTIYNAKLIPVCTPGGKVDVFFGTALRQMMNLVLYL